ncbi:MAG: winged helix-turn-helix domain-containing protein [Methanobacteriota archaeon]
MMNLIEEFGQYAGKIWHTLNTDGPLSETKLLDKTMLDEKKLKAAIGWLARENKICKNGTVYKLGETNLAPKIGNDAGKLWTVLTTKKEIDISTISKVTRIKEQDAYSALGWLAREDKIETRIISTPKDKKIKIKLK